MNAKSEGCRQVLLGRERIVFLRLAEALVPESERRLWGGSTADLLRRAEEHLARCQKTVRWLFRFSLLLFEWGTFFFRTSSSWEHFCELHPRARRRYVRFWMNHKARVMRQIFLFLRTMVLSSFYDSDEVAHQIGFDPPWRKPC